MLLPFLLLAAEANLDAIRQGMAAPMKGVTAVHLVAVREDVYTNGALGTATYEYAAGTGGKFRLGLKLGGSRDGLLVTDGAAATRPPRTDGNNRTYACRSRAPCLLMAC